MELARLEVLVAVVQEKGFARAAERLRRTQPAVSQAIRRLEEELGRPVFDRSTKSVTLTDAGAVVYDHALQMLNLARDARSAVEALADLRRGRVVIGASEYTVVHLLPILAAYRARHPDIKIEVKRKLSSQLPTELLRREVELGVLTYRPMQAGLDTVPFASDDLALLVAPAHRLARRSRVSVRELGGEAFLAHNQRSPYREKVLQTFARLRTHMDIALELPTLESIKRLVAQGQGVSLMPRRAAQEEIARGDVVAVDVKEMRLARTIYFAFRSEGELSHAARAFIRASPAGQAMAARGG